MHERVWSAMEAALSDDPDFRDHLKRSAARIVREKARHYLSPPSADSRSPAAAPSIEGIPAPEGASFFFDLACRSTTLIAGAALPVEIDHAGKVLLAGQFGAFFDEGSRRFTGAETHYFTYSPFYRATEAEIKAFAGRAESYDTIVFCLANPRSLAYLKALEPHASKTVVLSVLTPIYLREVPWIQNAVAVYGTSADSFKAGFGAIMGDFEPEGILPVTIR